MNASQTHIIRDYLRRYAAPYVGGLLIHLLVAIASTSTKDIPLFGLILGSAFVLGMEFFRGGNTTARTMLAKPITASQLASAWRFVALILPAMLFFVVLLVGVLIGKAMGGNKVSVDGFVLLALLQTGMLGMFFFALTGLQTAPVQAAGFGEKCSNLVFGLLWGLSIPVVMYTPQLQVTSYSELTPAHLFAWLFLIVVTVVGWFRAETLVARRTVRRTAEAGRPRTPRVKGAMPWRQFGGLRYFMSLFGSATLTFFVFMLLVTWFGTNLLFGSGGAKDEGFLYLTQLGMFVPIAGLVSMFQIMPMLRILRTMPQRLTSLTNIMVLWPFFLIILFSVVGYGFHALMTGFQEHAYGLRIARGIAAGAVILLTLPVFLRYGLNIKSVFAMMFVVSVSNTFSVVVDRDLKIAEPQQWLLIGIILATVLPLAWFLTHRTLRSEHPWRIKQFTFGSLRRAA